MQCWFTRGYPFTTWCFQTFVILTLTWGDDPIWRNIVEMGWNHQLAIYFWPLIGALYNWWRGWATFFIFSVGAAIQCRLGNRDGCSIEGCGIVTGPAFWNGEKLLKMRELNRFLGKFDGNDSYDFMRKYIYRICHLILVESYCCRSTNPWTKAYGLYPRPFLRSEGNMWHSFFRHR